MAQPFETEGVGRAADALSPSFRRLIEERPERALDLTPRDFRTHTDGDRIAPDDSRSVEARQNAGKRAIALARPMGHALNGDGRVTWDEYKAAVRRPVAEARARFACLAATLDRDADGAISLVEAVRSLGAGGGSSAAGRRHTVDSRSVDIDGDGTVTQSEVRAVVAAIAAVPGTARTPPSSQADAGKCVLPALPDGADAILVGGNAGSGVSTVALDGLNSLTSVAKLQIEPGEAPPYIFASSKRPVVWKLEGAVERVATVVVEPPGAAEGPGAGVVGLPQKRVAFLPAGSCAEAFTWSKSTIAKRVARRVAMELGVEPEKIAVVAHSALYDVRLPSGEARLRPCEGARNRVVIRDGTLVFPGHSIAERGLPASVSTRQRTALPGGQRPPGSAGASNRRPGNWRLSGRGRVVQRFRSILPDGVVAIDPGDVLAPGPGAKFDILPAQAGLIQLLDSGAMREEPGGMFLLTRPIARFPAELRESPEAGIVIDTGVPVPAGRPGKTWVFLRETGACISGAICE